MLGGPGSGVRGGGGPKLSGVTASRLRGRGVRAAMAVIWGYAQNVLRF